jgi:hypothetical protein
MSLYTWGLTACNKMLHRWEHADSSKCPHCEYSESAAHMICSCPNPAYAKIRKEWQRDMHDSTKKAVPEGLASDLKQL